MRIEVTEEPELAKADSVEKTREVSNVIKLDDSQSDRNRGEKSVHDNETDETDATGESDEASAPTQLVKTVDLSNPELADEVEPQPEDPFMSLVRSWMEKTHKIMETHFKLFQNHNSTDDIAILTDKITYEQLLLNDKNTSLRASIIESLADYSLGRSPFRKFMNRYKQHKLKQHVPYSIYQSCTSEFDAYNPFAVGANLL